MSDSTVPLAGRITDGTSLELGVAASTTILKGTLVSMNASGYLEDAVDTSGFFFMGVAADSVTGAATDGTQKVTVWTTGVFKFDCTNDAVTDIGKWCYATDNQTVSTTATTNVGAVGRIVGINPDGTGNSVLVMLMPNHVSAD